MVTSMRVAMEATARLASDGCRCRAATTWRSRSSWLHRAETLSEVADERVAEQELERAVRRLGRRVLAKPLRQPESGPVGGAVTRAAIALWVDERLREVDGVRVHTLPVGRELPRHPPQQVRGQVRYTHPGQDQESGLIGDEPD